MRETTLGFATGFQPNQGKTSVFFYADGFDREGLRGGDKDFADDTDLRERAGSMMPEESETTTYGLVFQPPGKNNLLISLDYWNIEQTDRIDTFGHEDQLAAMWCAPN